MGTSGAASSGDLPVHRDAASAPATAICLWRFQWRHRPPGWPGPEGPTVSGLGGTTGRVLSRGGPRSRVGRCGVAAVCRLRVASAALPQAQYPGWRPLPGRGAGPLALPLSLPGSGLSLSGQHRPPGSSSGRRWV